VKAFEVKEDTDLFAYLLSLGFKRTRIKQLLKFRAVFVNENPVDRHDYHLAPGDQVTVSKNQKSAPAAPKFGIRIVYEDEALLVIDKPEGLLSIATDTEKIKTAYFQLNEYLKERDPAKKERIFIVHRLDRETSGLLIFAKTESVKRRLQHGWADADKQYFAVIEGVPKEKERTLGSYLNETASHLVYEERSSGKAKYAMTRYTVLKSGRKYSLVEVGIDTGRKHQIRVQLSSIGHPVAGDKKYGAETNPLKRLALHASRLSISHPLDGKRIQFESKAPREFFSLIERMQS
jgi:23S rRNA pseudouridine1911/1915/1917 synthase